jgi:hypothetical protein
MYLEVKLFYLMLLANDVLRRSYSSEGCVAALLCIVKMLRPAANEINGSSYQPMAG